MMFHALHPMESISLKSFVLLEHLAILLTSTLEINCYLKNFLNKAIVKPFLNCIDDTTIWYLNSKMDLTKDFRNLNSMVTWCINWKKKLLALIIFSAQFIKIISHYKRIGYYIYVFQQTACLVVSPITVGNLLFSLIARRWVGLQTLW